MLGKELNPNEWAIINETECFRAIGHRIMVLEDEFRSGYECKACDGSGHTNIKCKHCKGTGLHKGKEENGSCPDCEVGTSDGRKSLGYELCSVCNGRSGLIVVPDSSKRRPLTGRIVSAGRDVTEFKVGDRVMYTNFTGTDFDLKGGVRIRVMLDHDVMTEYKQLKKGASVGNSGSSQKEATDLGVAPLAR